MKVAAWNSYGEGSFSSANADSVQIEAAPVDTVSTVVLSKTSTSITATWTSSPSTALGYGYAPITAYKWQYKLHSASSYGSATSISAGSALTFSVTGLTTNT
jgi:hypothetical protein